MKVVLMLSCFLGASLCNTQEAEIKCSNQSIQFKHSPAKIEPVMDKHEAALLLLLGFGGLSVILALVYNAIRRYVFDDVHNLDSTFDAGGNVSASLTAVTLAAQLLWPADLMQSATVAVKFGIAGVFWYCAVVLVNLSLFPLFSYKFKTKAPGAKTYLQIILARSGRRSHSIFCAFALLVNVVTLASITVGGIAVLQVAVKDANPEYCVLLLAILCGSYTFIGGLGSTFYVSYFNLLATFIILSMLVINIFYLDVAPFGTLEGVYTKVNCLPKVKGNRDGSYFTFFSEGSMLWAVQGLFVVSSISYCDQASWQSRIAAKPLQGALGFLLASLIWYAVPATIGTVAGITYLAKSAEDPTVHLSEEQINSGIVSAFMSQEAMGRQGGVMMLTMLTMLTMSTGSGEIMAVASIIVYDIYQTYIRPFRFKLSPNQCIFCGLKNQKSEQSMYSPPPRELTSDDLCKCPPAFSCVSCKSDLEKLQSQSKVPGQVVQYKCDYHGAFRTYQENLINFKNWCILWITLAFIPFGLALHASGVDLNWTLLTGAVLTVPCFPGVLLCILWSKLTSHGLISGCIVGLTFGIGTDLLVAYVYYKGEGGFLMSTSEMYAVVAGSSSGLISSLITTVAVSLATHSIRSAEDEKEVWIRLREIDNPLHPWSMQFVDEFPEVKDGVTRPTLSQLEHVSRQGRIASIAGCVIIVIVFIFIIPGAMAGLEVLTATEFKIWTTIITSWCIIMAIIIIVVTPIEEVKSIVLQLRAKTKRNKNSESSYSNNGRDRPRQVCGKNEENTPSRDNVSINRAFSNSVVAVNRRSDFSLCCDDVVRDDDDELTTVV